MEAGVEKRRQVGLIERLGEHADCLSEISLVKSRSHVEMLQSLVHAFDTAKLPA